MTISGGSISITDVSGSTLQRVVPGTADAAVSERISLLSYSFADGASLDSQWWTTSAVGSGSATQSSGKVTLTTGATSNSTISITSTKDARYAHGTVNAFAVALRLGDTGTTNNTRRWGAFDANDGYFFELSGTTLRAVSRKATADTTASITGVTLDTNYHIWEILYFGTDVMFYVDGVVIHRLQATTATLTASLTNPVRLEDNNSGGSTSVVTMDAREIGVARFGDRVEESLFRYFNATGTTTIRNGPGRLARVILSSLGTSATMTIYDNTAGSGTIIGVINLASTVGTFEFNVAFTTGLTVVIAGTAAGSSTVVYS